MSKPIPALNEHMTRSPHAIGVDQPLALAETLMRKHGIRHLPVLDGGVLVGVITDRDLNLVKSLRDVDPTKVSVEEAMSTSVYAVSPETPLDDVVSEMAERKYGCAVAMKHGQAVGIFTTVDACRSLCAFLRAA